MIRLNDLRRGLMPAIATLALAFSISPALAQGQARPQEEGRQRGPRAQGEARGQDEGARRERGERRMERGNRGDRGDRGRFGRGGAGRGDRGGFGRGRGGRDFGMMRMGLGNLDVMMSPYYLRRDLTLFVDELGLGEEQGPIVEALLNDYQEAFGEAADAMRDQFRELRPGPDPQDETAQETRRALIEDVRAIRGEMRAMRQEAGEGREENPDARADLEARFSAIRERMNELRPPRPEGAELEALRELFTKLRLDWERQRSSLNSEFLIDVMALLTDEQTLRWPTFERTLRRRKTLDRGRLSGESVNIFLVLREMDLDQEVWWEIGDTLEAYAIALDQSLQRRNEYLDSDRSEYYAAISGGDPDRAASLADREADLRTAVRDVNQQYSENLATIISGLAGDVVTREFRSNYAERAFPRIYGGNRMQRAFDVAKEFDPIDEGVLTAIIDLEQSYAIDLDVKNRQLVRITRKTEPDQISARIRRFSEMMASRGQERGGRFGGNWRGERSEDPVRIAMGERSEMDDRYRRQLEAILTPEQVEELPAARRERGERGRRGERGGNEGNRRRGRGGPGAA